MKKNNKQTNMKTNDDSEKYLTYDVYLSRRKQYESEHDNTFKIIDKTIIQWSTGALVLSITFLEKIGEPYNTCTFTLLVFSWSLFLLSMLSFLLSFIFARKLFNALIDKTDWEYNNQKKYIPNKEINIPIKKYTNITIFFNWLTLISFFIGCVLFFSYGIYIQNNKTRGADLKKNVNKTFEGKTEEDVKKDALIGKKNLSDSDSKQVVNLKEMATIPAAEPLPPKGKHEKK